EQLGIDLVMPFDVLFGKDGTSRGHASDEGQSQLFAQNILELNAARGARNQIDDALALQGTQVFLGGIGRLEAERACNLRTGGRHAVLRDRGLDEPQNLSLPRREISHGIYLYM